MKIEALVTPQLLFWTRGTDDIITESQVIAQVYCVIHSGFVSQKLLQVLVAVNGL